MKESCDIVASIECKAAPGGGRHTRARCFHCGNAVCTGCSRLRTNRYKDMGFPRRVRVCANCLVDHYGEELFP